MPPPKNYREVIDCLPSKIKKFFEKVVKDKVKSESLEGNRDKEVEKYISSFWTKSVIIEEDKFDVNKLELIFGRIIK